MNENEEANNLNRPFVAGVCPFNYSKRPTVSEGVQRRRTFGTFGKGQISSTAINSSVVFIDGAKRSLPESGDLRRTLCFQRHPGSLAATEVTHLINSPLAGDQVNLLLPNNYQSIRRCSENRVCPTVALTHRGLSQKTEINFKEETAENRIKFCSKSCPNFKSFCPEGNAIGVSSRFLPCVRWTRNNVGPVDGGNINSVRPLHWREFGAKSPVNQQQQRSRECVVVVHGAKKATSAAYHRSIATTATGTSSEGGGGLGLRAYQRPFGSIDAVRFPPEFPQEKAQNRGVFITEEVPLQQTTDECWQTRPSCRHHRVFDYRKQTAVRHVDPSEDKSCVTRWALCTALGSAFGVLLYLYLYFHLLYIFVVAVVTAAVATACVIVACLASKRVRCCWALVVPSVPTSHSGRLGFLTLATGILFAGPLANVCLNLKEVSRSLSCGIDQANSQAAIMTDPYSALVAQLNATVARLEDAVARAEDDLRPLDERLRQLDRGLNNGKLQLFGSQKACRSYVDRAFGACVTSISRAKVQCLGVLEALANVYSHAQGVLDSLNPDRWAPKSTNISPTKRQTPLEGNHRHDQDWSLMLSSAGGQSDICEPLHSVAVCRGLDASDHLCRPSRWVGHAIHAAVNSTVSALAQLGHLLRTNVGYDLPLPVTDTGSASGSRDGNNESRDGGVVVLSSAREHFADGFDATLESTELVLLSIARVLPLITCLLIGCSASAYLTTYLCVEPIYLPTHLDGSASSDLLRVEPVPLQQLETLVGGRSDGSSPAVVLHLLFAALCGFMDVCLFWGLNVVRRNWKPPFEVSGGRNVESLVRGSGSLAQILKELLRGLHPGHWFGFIDGDGGDGGYACLPAPIVPSVTTLSVVGSLYAAFFVGVALTGRLETLKTSICARFYPRRRHRRGALVRVKCLRGITGGHRRCSAPAATAAAAAAAVDAGCHGGRSRMTGEDSNLLRQLIGLKEEDISSSSSSPSSSSCRRFLFQRSLLCVVCRSRTGAQPCPCNTCQHLPTTPEPFCCHECRKSSENNAHPSNVTKYGTAQTGRVNSYGYVDIL